MNKEFTVSWIVALLVALLLLSACSGLRTSTTPSAQGSTEEVEVSTSLDEVKDLNELTSEIDQEISFDELENLPLE